MSKCPWTFGCVGLACAMLVSACMPRPAASIADERARLIDAARKSSNPGFAVLIAQRHVEENPGDYRAHLAYGRLLVELRQCKKAIPVLRRAQALVQDHWQDAGQEAARLQVKSHLQCQEYAQALHLAREHERRHPGDIDMLNMQGVALDHLGNAEQAQSVWHKALSLRPSAKITYNLALSLLLAGHTERSLELLETIPAGAAEIDVTSHSILFLEALSLARDDRKGEARVLLSSLVPHDQVEPLLARMK